MNHLREMSPLMRELCIYYAQLRRENRPFESDLDDEEIATAFLRSAAEVGWARLVKTELGDSVWEATPTIFSDIGGLDAWAPSQSPRDAEVKECAEDGPIQISQTKKLVRDLDQIADRLMYTWDDMQAALDVLVALRRLSFHLSEAIGDDPLKGFQPKRAETPGQDGSKPLPSE